MAVRIAVVIDERDQKLGKITVPDTAFVIRHQGVFYARTPEGCRLTRVGGMAAVFRPTDVFIRDKLEPL